MIDSRFLGFLIAGGVNTLFGYAAFGGLILLGVTPHLALIVSTAAGILFNFLSTGTVFGTRDRRLLPRFLAVYGAMLLLNMALLDIALRLGIGPLVAQGIAVALIAPLNFLTMRRFVFHGRREHVA